MSGIRIRCVKVEDVHRYACDAVESLTPDDISPLSRIRAKAWSRNPHAEPGDVGLVVAHAGDRCAGYLGLMPARLAVDGTHERVHWTSTLFVPPSFRGAGVGGLLMLRALALPLNLAATLVSEEAQRLYQALRLQRLEPLPYFELDLQARNLPLRVIRKALRPLSPRVASALDKKGGLGLTPVRELLYRSLVAGWRKRHPACKTRDIDWRSERDFASALQDVTGTRFLRDADVLKWMLDDPWVTTRRSERTPNLHFDDHRDHFEYRPVEILDGDGSRKGFAIFRLNGAGGRNELHVLDHHFDDPSDRDLLLGPALETARAFRADRVCLPVGCRAEIERSSLARMAFVERSRDTYVRFRPGSLAAGAQERIQLDYCDGDVPFA